MIDDVVEIDSGVAATRKAEANTLLSPRFYKTDYAALERLDVTPVRAEWDTFEISLREITDLRVGDVIEMPVEQLRQTNLLLNGVPKFVGTVGLDTDHIAVQLTAKVAHPHQTIVTHSHGRKNP